MDAPEPAPELPTRRELTAAAKQIRNDWPLPDAVRNGLLQTAVSAADPANGGSVRLQLTALKVIQGFARLQLAQQKLDLDRERAASGESGGGTVADAMRRIEQIERDMAADPEGMAP